MDNRTPRLGRKRPVLIEGFWFPAGLGVLVAGLAWLTYGHHARPSPVSSGLFISCLLLVIGESGARQIIQYATTADPLFEQEREASARFYARERSRWRLLASFVSGAGVWFGANIGLTESEQTIALLAGMALYGVPMVFDLARSVSEARRLFPPSGAQSQILP